MFKEQPQQEAEKSVENARSAVNEEKEKEDDELADCEDLGEAVVEGD